MVTIRVGACIISGTLVLAGCVTTQTSGPIQTVDNKIIKGMPSIDSQGRIAYIFEQNTNEGKTSSLYVMAPDGTRAELIAQIQGLIFSPVWSFDGKKLAYAVQMPKSHPRIFVHDMVDNEVRQINTPEASSLSPSFSSDGRYLLLSISQNGNADIYRKNLVEGSLERLTTLPSTEVQPAYAPDGQSFIYVSDKAKAGRAELYQYIFATGEAIKLKSGYAASPEISRDGTKIGFLNGSKASIMLLATGQIINIAETGLDEPARLSPSGKYSVYPMRTSNGVNQLIIRSLDSGVSYNISTHTVGRIRSPAWGAGSQ